MISIFRWLFEIPDPAAAESKGNFYSSAPTDDTIVPAGSEGQTDSGSYTLSRI